MAITLLGNNAVANIVTTTVTEIRNEELAEVKYQTDNLATKWGTLKINEGIKIDAGVTMYFKSQGAGELATIEF